MSDLFGIGAVYHAEEDHRHAYARAITHDSKPKQTNFISVCEHTGNNYNLIHFTPCLITVHVWKYYIL